MGGLAAAVLDLTVKSFSILHWISQRLLYRVMTTAASDVDVLVCVTFLGSDLCMGYRTRLHLPCAHSCSAPRHYEDTPPERVHCLYTEPHPAECDQNPCQSGPTSLPWQCPCRSGHMTQAIPTLLQIEEKIF